MLRSFKQLDQINGYIIKGKYWIADNGAYKCLALCKICKKEFTTNYHSLHRMKSCGCARPSLMKKVGAIINGFKIIKDLGYEKERRVVAECKECGKHWETCPRYLEKQKSCGCRRQGKIACTYVKSHPQLARTFRHMMGRCYNKNNQDYYNYGARGITICDEWLIDRNKFCEWALQNGFENDKGLSIDRIDNNKGYSPENCRWESSTGQSRNTRRTKLTMELAREIRKEYPKMSQQKIAEKYGICQTAISSVLLNKTWKEI